jgi:class 3 adenylate cyclase
MSKPIRPVDAELFQIVANTICSRCWSDESVDTDLHLKIDDCLNVLGVSGVITHFGREHVTLMHGATNNMTQLLRVDFAEIERQIAESRTEHIYFHIAGTEYRGKRIEDVTDNPEMSYALLAYEGRATTTEENEARSFHAGAAAPMLFQVLQHRVRLFAPFPPRISEMYWDNAPWMGRQAPPCHPQTAPPWETGDISPVKNESPLLPPWEAIDPLQTVTLGFDLRKSTFCMDNADPRKFARWLDHLTQILMTVAHSYGAIFDKFTGDGAIAHFLTRETQIVQTEEAVMAAVQCAIAMSNATSYHIRELRKILRLDSELLGGGIGIDIAPARWSLDYRHNPITVGRGVVTACRLMDGTPAHAIRITNIGYQILTRGTIKSAFHPIRFKSKEYGDELRLRVWQIDDATRIGTAIRSDVEAICNLVYSRDRSREAVDHVS